MKRIDVIRHLERHGAQFLREGGNHSERYPLPFVTQVLFMTLRLR
jgi:hypothetical protein